MEIDEYSLGRTFAGLQDDARLSFYYVTLMAISGVLAAVAMLTSSIPVLIGAMVVAPAMPPLALIALSVVVNRPRSAARGFGVALVGLLLAVSAAMFTTWLLNVVRIIPENANLAGRELLEERVRPGWYSVVAALAAGCAGMVATVWNKTDTLVGSVAALALVPAAAAGGIALQSGEPARALGGLFLLIVNLVVIIAVGILVLLVLGRGRPRGMRQARRRSKARSGPRSTGRRSESRG